MKPWIVVAPLAASLWATSTLQAQQVPDVTAFAAAYDTVKMRLPSGLHAVVLSDRLLRSCRAVSTPDGGWAIAPPAGRWDEEEVQRGNREFAAANGLAVGPSDAAATVSFRLVSAAADSAHVDVATRYPYPYPNSIYKELIALYEVHLVRNNGGWAVVKAWARAEGHN
jgi:hypothetical protein